MYSAPQLREQATVWEMPAGSAGRAEGHHPHLLDAGELLHQSWGALSASSIGNRQVLRFGSFTLFAAMQH